MLYLQMMMNASRRTIRAQISRCALIRLVHLSVYARKDTRRQEIPAQVRCYNNNNHFFCANILKNQAQWRDKTKGLSKIILRQCVSHQWMDEDARKLRRIGSIKEIGF